MTGVNIPDMIKIVEEHGLVAVPIDLNLDTMAPNDWEDIKCLTTDKVSSCQVKEADQSDNVRIPLRCSV
jgi:hypothetical protein